MDRILGMLMQLIKKANALYELGRYEEAIEDFDRALAIDPNNISALSNKGLSLRNLGMYRRS